MQYDLLQQGKSKNQPEYSLHGLHTLQQVSLATGFGGVKLISISTL
jgi:hypothetical protein